MEHVTEISTRPFTLLWPPQRQVCKLSIVVPTLNERGNIGPLLGAIESALGTEGWEVIFVDDDSPDGTAEAAKALACRDVRVRCIRRVGRYGLSTAVIEGILSSSADYVAVIDGDLQHDEALLRTMIGILDADRSDIVVASRFMENGSASGLDGKHRRLLSKAGNRLARAVLKMPISDPMSGFFMMRRSHFEESAARLSGRGFKVLLDLLASAPVPLRVTEVPMTFRQRVSGTSKLDLGVELAFLGLLLDKAFGGLILPRFMAFSAVGGTGVILHLAVLKLTLLAHWPFTYAQALAAVLAMTSNFCLNNFTTYRDRRLTGWRFLVGLLSFYAVCSIGFVSNVGVGHALFSQANPWWLSGLLGAAVGAVWNYSVSSLITWREK
jgi:dolichol-phosphate mannosyltransferase